MIYKLPNEVNGRAVECSKQLIRITTYVGFFGARSEYKEIMVQELSNAQCREMDVTKECDKAIMTCDGDVCHYDGTPKPEFKWLSSSVHTGSICLRRVRILIAKDQDSVVFGNTCKVKDLNCKLKNSIIVWNPDIVDPCPYRNLRTSNNWDYKPEIGALYDKTTRALIKLAKQSKFATVGVCLDYNGISPITMIYSSEGVYVTGDERARLIKKADSNQIDFTAVHELMLVEEDGKLYSEMVGMSKMNEKICITRLTFLRELLYRPGVFEYLPSTNDADMIVYSKNGIIVVPQCISIRKVTYKNNTEFCTEDVPVEFLVSGKSLKGYMQHNKIIKSSTNKRVCGPESHIFLPKNEQILSFDGAKITNIVKINEIKKIGFMREAELEYMNFPHFSDIITPRDRIMSEMYSPVIVKSNFEGNFKVEDSESEVKTVFGEWIYYAKYYFDEFKTVILIILIIITLLIILFFTLKVVLCIRRRNTSKSRSTQLTSPNYANLTRSQQDFREKHGLMK